MKNDPMCKACISSEKCNEKWPDCNRFNSKCWFCTIEMCQGKSFHEDYSCFRMRKNVVLPPELCLFYDKMEKHCRKTNKACTNCGENTWADNKIGKGKYEPDEECLKCADTQWCKHGPKHVPCDAFKASNIPSKPPAPKVKQPCLDDLK